MRPLKAKELIPEVATQTGFSQETVNLIVSFYWQEVRRSLSGLKHGRVHITNLGDFKVKHWKLDERIEKFEHFEEYNRQKGLQQMTARFKTAETLFDLKGLRAILEEENQRAEFIKMHKRTAYVTKRERDQNMEEPQPDN